MSQSPVGFGGSTDEQPLQGCSRLLHLLAGREKMFMVMASHMGQDQSAGRPTGLAVAGLLASQVVWEDFGNACEAEARRGRNHRDPSRLMSERKIAGIGAVVCPRGRQTIGTHSLDAFPTQLLPESLLLCFEHCVLEAARRLQPAPAGETVCFVMDWNEPLASAALWHLEDLHTVPSQPLSKRLGALGFESRLNFPPLQAAHWLAARCFGALAGPVPHGADLHWLDCTMIESAPPARSRETLHAK